MIWKLIKVEPTFNLEEQFVVNDLQYVFGIDSLESSRPINFEVTTPSQINQMFDAISYEKGGSILRMCAHLIGLDTFRRGVRLYLEAKLVEYIILVNAFGSIIFYVQRVWQHCAR